MKIKGKSFSLILQETKNQTESSLKNSKQTCNNFHRNIVQLISVKWDDF